MKKIARYQNGNGFVELFDDGTRVITTPDTSFKFDMPLNIDIRCSTRCPFGYNPETKKTFCEFCHESSRTDGIECDYDALKEKLIGLPQGIELAVGCNEFTDGFFEFLIWCGLKGYITNLTINQGQLKKYEKDLRGSINLGIIKGLGISYRSAIKWDISSYFLKYPNSVFHVIAGIDNFYDVLSLKDRGVKKLLILGEKDFGFNEGKVDLTTQSHKEWYWWISKLFDEFDIVSFDNLALDQLNIKRFLTDDQWEVFNQGEYSFYINAVEQYFAPSSRSPEKTNWNNITVKDYFKSLKK